MLVYEIKIIIDEGGIFQGVYVSPELQKAEVEVIDFVTDNPEQLKNASQRYDEIIKRVRKGQLVGIQ